MVECEPCGFNRCEGLNYYNQDYCCECDHDDDLGFEVWCVECLDALHSAQIHLEIEELRGN